MFIIINYRSREMFYDIFYCDRFIRYYEFIILYRGESSERVSDILRSDFSRNKRITVKSNAVHTIDTKKEKASSSLFMYRPTLMSH